eukprot:366569-Chlamydomonas_euryale.AAC.14
MATVLGVLLCVPLVAALLVALAALKLLLDVRGRLKAVEAIPTFAGEGWFWCHWAWWSQPDVWRQVQQLAKTLGPAIRLRFGPEVVVMVTDPVSLHAKPTWRVEYLGWL